MSETILEDDARVKAEDELHRDKARLDFIFKSLLPVSKWDTLDGFAKIVIKELARHREDIDKLMEEENGSTQSN
jgi:hypothetical protein